jgi:hypothetical protein
MVFRLHMSCVRCGLCDQVYMCMSGNRNQVSCLHGGAGDAVQQELPPSSSSAMSS